MRKIHKIREISNVDENTANEIIQYHENDPTDSLADNSVNDCQ